jgi:tRNA-U20-dihydrouridine synthase
MKIGKLSLRNNVFLAPMAGITDLSFRLLVRRFGCAMAFTEMISANGLVMGTEKSYRYLESSSDDKPLGVQIFGSDPGIISEAVRVVTDRGADLIDINMGCPVKKVLKTGAGGALMRDPLKVALIWRRAREATPLPLTVKLRSGWNHDEINTMEIARIAQDCGVDAVILHPRTVSQRFSGAADWSLIEKMKRCLSIPVVGNGDIRRPEDARRMLDVTGCDGVMVGRGVLGRPWIVRGIIQYLEGKNVYLPPALQERESVMNQHLEMNIDFLGEEIGVRNFRKHVLWYTKGLTGSSRFREMVGRIDNKKSLLNAVHGYIQFIDEESRDTNKTLTFTGGPGIISNVQ